MIKIPLTQNKIALIDDEDYELIAGYKWYLHTNGYARCSTPKKMYLHRLIMSTPSDMITDHINGNRLDNRRSNLRICTESQNRMNTILRSDNKSGYKGVSWSKEKKKWTVRVKIDNKAKYLGYYTDRLEAARVYNLWASKIYGEFAKLNEIL